MARISDASKERVREAVDIVDLIGHYTELRRHGTQYMGRCPFHEDNSPSFSVNAADKVYYCFGCQVSGDLFSFVMEKEALDFPAAIEHLADLYNVELEYEELDPAAAARQQQRERLLELLERATKFYERTLAEAPEASNARLYLTERGFSPEVTDKFRIGYAPKAWDKLFVPALSQGFTEQELLDAGLVQRNDRGQLYDRFRGRIIFPLADRKGIVRGFGARGMRESDRPKYLNSPEGPVYHKGMQIFGINHARKAAASKKRVIAVEGYADVLALHDAGFEEAVAVMGTAMTEHQAAELAHLAPTVLLALDADQSGRRAALRAAEMLSAQRGVEVLVVEITGGKDPDELLKSEGPEAFEQLLARAVTVAQFAINQVFAEGDLSDARGREQVLDALAPVISAMPAGPARDEQVRVAADRLGVSDAVLRQAVEERGSAAQGSAAARQPQEQQAAPVPRRTAAPDPTTRTERMFMAQCLSNAEIGLKQLGKVRDEMLATDLSRALRDHLLKAAGSPLAGIDALKPELREAVTEVVMLSELEDASAEVIELGFLQLEKAELDRRIAGAPGEQKAQIELERQEVIRRIGALSAEFA